MCLDVLLWRQLMVDRLLVEARPPCYTCHTRASMRMFLSSFP